jgi:hypothetical protein
VPPKVPTADLWEGSSASRVAPHGFPRVAVVLRRAAEGHPGRSSFTSRAPSTALLSDPVALPDGGGARAGGRGTMTGLQLALTLVAGVTPADPAPEPGPGTPAPAVEPARADLEAAHSEDRKGRLIAVLGSGALTWGVIALVKDLPPEKSMGGLAVGTGLWLLALKVFDVRDRHLKAATDAYNAQLPPLPEVSIAPFVAPVAPAAGRGSVGRFEGGLVLRF